MSLALAGCGWSPDNPFDDGSCDEPCAAGAHCFEGHCITGISIKAGSFTMGSAAEEPCRKTDEVVHLVSLSQPLEMGQSEVTQQQFLDAQGYNPSIFAAARSVDCKTCPVEGVTWHEAASYCNARSTAAGLGQCYLCNGGGKSVTCVPAKTYAGSKIYTCDGYRLPTEAEWEYAYRAGTSGALYTGEISGCDSDDGAGGLGWYAANAGNRTRPVTGKTPNALGLYDMAGNVWEWVHDWYSDASSADATNPAGPAGGTYRVIRGGAWSSPSSGLRAAARGKSLPGIRSHALGFRCVRSTKP